MKYAAALALAFAFVSSAQSAGLVYNIDDVCKFDKDQYCKNISKKRLRDLRECLAKHERDLLPRCQDHYKEAK